MSLFSKLRGRANKPAPAPPFTAPFAPERPVCVIGDIHGCDRLLGRMFDQIDGLADAPITICVGDYTDRGEESRAVIERLAARASEPDLICLQGNHEEFLLKFIDAPKEGKRWLRHGGLQTLASFGVGGVTERPDDAAAERASAQFADVLGEDRIDWLRNLPLSHETGNVAVVHAAADPALPIAAQAPDVLKWGHPEFETRTRQDGIWVVHGHTIVPMVDPHQGRACVDTGAYATGRMSALLIRPDGTSEVLVATYS